MGGRPGRVEILGPYFLENFMETVGKSEVQNGGFQVVVGGDAYGSGSSREVAVVAHRGAGIELVIADSFQRIFQENMVYSGMPFTSDRGVLTRLQAGEDVLASEVGLDLIQLYATVEGLGQSLDFELDWSKAGVEEKLGQTTHQIGYPLQWQLGTATITGRISFTWYCNEDELQIPERVCYELIAAKTRDRLLHLALRDMAPLREVAR